MKIRLKKKWGLFLGCLLIISCTPVYHIGVNSVNQDNALNSASIIYALPQTVLDITVTAEETRIIPGPYEKFADKYLGIHNVPSRTEKYYSLSNIKIESHLEADPDYIFAIQGITDPGKLPGLSRLFQDSLILDAKNFSENKIYSFAFAPLSNETSFTDLSVKRNFEAEKDVEISSVMPDTIYRAGSRLKEKTIEQKAEEAANFLIKLKKRRFKLVSGQYDSMPGEEGLAEALNELARLEKEYLSLFIGKRIQTKIQKVFHYIPVPSQKTNPVVLFRFSGSDGFVTSGETSGIPVTLEMKPYRIIRELEDYRLPTKTSGNMVPYRIPDQVNIRLLVGEQVWSDALIPVFQYGVAVTATLTE